jgi:hypothetical protein
MWAVLMDMEDGHGDIIPDHDGFNHILGPDCPCNPKKEEREIGFHYMHQEYENKN